MNITIKAAHNIGDTVYMLTGGRIVSDVVKSIIVSEFTIDKLNYVCTAKPRYILECATGKFYESDLHADPADIVKRLQAQVKEIKSKAA